MSTESIVKQLRTAADQLAEIPDPVAFTLAEVCRGRALILQHEASASQLCVFCGGERGKVPAAFPCSVTGSHGPHFAAEPPDRRRCQARQESDEMVCSRCRVRWDVNDPEPPRCVL